jgi:hypothetical protein
MSDRLVGVGGQGNPARMGTFQSTSESCGKPCNANYPVSSSYFQV